MTENVPRERKAHISVEMEYHNITSHDIERGDVATTEIAEDPVVISTRGMLESLPPLSSECCIYRVPKKLRKVNVEAYTPQLVSIGPLHFGEQHLREMEEHKLRYLRTFLNRIGWSLDQSVQVVRRWENRARDCYAETIELSSDEFVKMILVDGCFIVEIFLRHHFNQLRDEVDRIFHRPWMNDVVRHDLVLIENQLPIFVLEGFFDWVPPVSIPDGNSTTFLGLTKEYFNHFVREMEVPGSLNGIKHFVDFIHHFYLSSFSTKQHEGDANIERPPSVTQLQEAGITFRKGTSRSLLDIKFADGILEIPHFKIWDSTESLIRNVIAFEQCHCTSKYISGYMDILDSLIKTSEDADLLIRHEIITNWIGSGEKVATLFNNIAKEIFIDSSVSSFSSICKDMNEYCKNRRHRWKATLKRDYFGTPWTIISFIAAVVRLILTIIQTTQKNTLDYCKLPKKI
ncbi:hypothetical protein L1049_014318 [Liquidambar formosana]|uniref:Uncharacterized protein n=1 Tax=Liquidambar formosana TaxID=63359 RepID=A0AAP0RQ87_LIQFO